MVTRLMNFNDDFDTQTDQGTGLGVIHGIVIWELGVSRLDCRIRDVASCIGSRRIFVQQNVGWDRCVKKEGVLSVHLIL